MLKAIPLVVVVIRVIVPGIPVRVSGPVTVLTVLVPRARVMEVQRRVIVAVTVMEVVRLILLVQTVSLAHIHLVLPRNLLLQPVLRGSRLIQVHPERQKKLPRKRVFKAVVK